MSEPEADEERALRSVALQNAKSILAERQRVERELFTERERLRILNLIQKWTDNNKG